MEMKHLFQMLNNFFDGCRVSDAPVAGGVSGFPRFSESNQKEAFMKLSGSSPARRPGMAQSATLWLIALLLGSVSQLALASSEANLVLPNLNDVALASFLGGISGLD